ncbi:MAG: tRNA pseudouridine(13) synthase TruD [Wenzhouxiangellaceae bacterium]|nr:tRNA pseudouridine(13) synthase TruD [Wenzhouxiangellaceae bacterium]
MAEAAPTDSAATGFAWSGPVGTGLIRSLPEDFRVHEDVGYAPSGDGEHLWLVVEKRGINTMDVVARLARLAGVPRSAVGFGGLKDRNALTVQPFSIHRPGPEMPDAAAWSDDDMRILSVTRHHRKIRRGRLAGNRFELTVREFCGDRERLAERLARIAAGGVPNGFGEQRFGGNNIARAHRLFRGELRRKPNRAKRGFYLSAARSLIFNRVLAARIAAGTWNRLIDGDIAMLEGSRSWFPADPDDPELVARAAALDLHPTGPLVGREPSPATGAALEVEQRVVEAERELADGLAKFRLETDRRALRMRVPDLDWTLAGDVLELRFRLRPGCYATAVLREVLDYADASRNHWSP